MSATWLTVGLNRTP